MGAMRAPDVGGHPHMPRTVRGLSIEMDVDPTRGCPQGDPHAGRRWRPVVVLGRRREQLRTMGLIAKAGGACAVLTRSPLAPGVCGNAPFRTDPSATSQA